MEQTIEPTVSFSLTVKDASRALRFYSEALGAEELLRMPSPEGGVAHAEFMIGNTRIYISDEAEEWHAFAMPEDAMASCLFSIMTEDCDTAYNQAIKIVENKEGKRSSRLSRPLINFGKSHQREYFELFDAATADDELPDTKLLSEAETYFESALELAREDDDVD